MKITEAEYGINNQASLLNSPDMRNLVKPKKMKVKFKAIQIQVEKLLTDVPRLRDSDNKLVANIWFSEIKLLENPPVTVVEFLKAYAEESLTKADTITRARRKIQEENPFLRGNNYEGRQAAQKQTKIDLGYGH